MTLIVCERCGKMTAKLERCNYCSKLICKYCEKSAKRKHKVARYFICKTCWGNLSLRKEFKSV